LELGFETIGNATLVCHDKLPVLVTDPWIDGDAYFGSWGLSHEIPLEVLEAIKNCQYVWISHGHPDHMSSRSLDLLRGKKFLLPDHVGGRIRDGFRERGFDVTVLKDRRWYSLSDKIRILCIADYNQDAVLLVDIGGTLVFNMNDASDLGWGGFVKRTIKNYKVSFLLKLTGFGDADMINIWHEDGTYIEPNAAKKLPVGKEIAGLTKEWGTRYFVPFSSMHSYQRADSVWARKYRTELSDYAVGFDSKTSELLPAFIRYEVGREKLERLDPAERNSKPIDPKEFGDDWSEPLESSDRDKITNYFKAISHLAEFLDFVAVRVGGTEHVVKLGQRRLDRGLTFEAPRGSLMTAVEYEIFDDMLVGNFMRVTIHGSYPRRWRPGGQPVDMILYPDFSPYVTKYADNGLAKSKAELNAYFRQYIMRAPLSYLKFLVERRSMEFALSSFDANSTLYRFARRTYRQLKGTAGAVPG